MAYITIKTNADEGMTLQERVLSSDLESEFFCTHLVERLRWAVEDAHAPPSPRAAQRPLAGAAGLPPAPQPFAASRQPPRRARKREVTHTRAKASPTQARKREVAHAHKVARVH